MKKLFLVLLVMPLYLVVTGFLPDCPPYDGLESVYLSDPTDCSKFYVCSNGTAYEMTCPLGLVFNENRTVCDFPGNVDCAPLLGDSDREQCSKEYDIIEENWDEVTLNYIVTGNANYRFIAQVSVNGQIQYRYLRKSEQRIQTERVLCPGYWGFCTEKTCGEEF